MNLPNSFFLHRGDKSKQRTIMIVARQTLRTLLKIYFIVCLQKTNKQKNGILGNIDNEYQYMYEHIKEPEKEKEDRWRTVDLVWLN